MKIGAVENQNGSLFMKFARFFQMMEIEYFVQCVSGNVIQANPQTQQDREAQAQVRILIKQKVMKNRKINANSVI